MPDLTLKLDVALTIPLAKGDFHALDKGVDAAKYILDLLKSDIGLPAENTINDLMVRSFALTTGDGLVNLGDCVSLLGGTATKAIAPVATSRPAATKEKSNASAAKIPAPAYLPYRGLWNPRASQPEFLNFLNTYGPEIHRLVASGNSYGRIALLLFKRHGQAVHYHTRSNTRVPPSYNAVGGYHHMWAYLNGISVA